MLSNKSKSLPHVLTLSALLAAPLVTFAGESAGDHSTDEAIREAWMEGKLETVYLMNRHLNNFTIDVDIEGDTAMIDGEVESEVDRELAEELARSIDGINAVQNGLDVVAPGQAKKSADTATASFSDTVEDATLAAEVKVKLLANSEVGGLGIDVEAISREIILVGEVDSTAEKDLAGQIAANVDGVADVQNKLSVKS